MAINMTPEIVWSDSVEFWDYCSSASDRAFKYSNMKPISSIDNVDITAHQADELYETGKGHHIFPADAALKIFSIDFFFDEDCRIAELAQPKVPYKGDLGIYRLIVTFIAYGETIMCGIAVDESHGDSGGTVEVAVLCLFDDYNGSYSVSPFSISEYGLYCTDYETLNDLGHWLGHFFCGVQYKMIHRPEIVRVYHHRIPKEERDEIKRHSGDRIRVVKVQKIINILAEEDENLPVVHKSHAITLPVWGVSGHWRDCKSGKRVWVRPYKKGRDRNKDGVYCGKEYRFVKEETV